MESSRPLPASPLKPSFTELTIASMGPKTSPRMREVMTSMIKHVHAFALETDLTVPEWFAVDKKILDALAHKRTGNSSEASTPTAVLGPMYGDDAPVRKNGDSMIVNDHNGYVTYMHGKVIDSANNQPIKGASIQVWQASSNGLYDQEDQEQMTGNLRGVFQTDEKGQYSFYCLKPTPYPIPSESPAATFLDFMDRSHFRPAHIHAHITHNNYTTLTTQIYSKDDPYLEVDASCAVLNALVVEFKPHHGDPEATLELEFDFKLAKKL